MEGKIKYLINMTEDELNELIENNIEFEISIKECIDEAQDDILDDIFSIISDSATTEATPNGEFYIEVEDKNKELFIVKVKELIEKFSINNGLKELITGTEDNICESLLNEIIEKVISYIQGIYEYSIQIDIKKYGAYIKEYMEIINKYIPETYVQCIKNNERNIELIDYVFSNEKEYLYDFMYVKNGSYDIYNISSGIEFKSNEE